MSKTVLSVIIPAYNEERRLGPALAEIVEFLRKQTYSAEIIVVDDGSKDRTVHVAEETLRDFPYKILRNPQNRGKGFAVKQGMLAGTGDYLLFSDADLSTPIEETSLFMEYLRGGFDVVIGSRALRESRIEIHQNFLREFMGKIFNLFALLFAFRNIHDSQCGFKCFRREAARDLFGGQKLEGFSFDAEILYLAQKKGYRILEAPVVWRDSPKSRVRLLCDPLAMFLDLVRIRWIHRS